MFHNGKRKQQRSSGAYFRRHYLPWSLDNMSSPVSCCAQYMVHTVRMGATAVTSSFRTTRDKKPAAFAAGNYKDARQMWLTPSGREGGVRSGPGYCARPRKPVATVFDFVNFGLCWPGSSAVRLPIRDSCRKSAVESPPSRMAGGLLPVVGLSAAFPGVLFLRPPMGHSFLWSSGSQWHASKD